MSQATLISIFDAPVKPVFSCWNCNHKKDIIMQNGCQMVRCRARGLLAFPDGCNSWSDGKDIEHWPEVLDGFVPKKYGGRA